MNSKFQPGEDMFDDVEGHVRHIDGPAPHDGADHGTVR